MKSASQMSLEIRRKKKAMQENPDLMDLSGEMTDKQDEDIMEQDSMTKELGLDHNTPKQHNEEPSEHAEEMADSHDTEPEKEEPETKHIRMMADGGSVLPKYMHPPKDPKLMAVGRGPMMAEGGEIDLKAKRRARIAKMMNR